MILAEKQATKTNGSGNQTITSETLDSIRRILIVDDHELVREQLSQMIQRKGDILVESVSSGSQALKEINQQNYSIVLADLRMPRMDGIQLIKEIKERNLPITVIVMTAFGSVDDAVEAMRWGAYDFLEKPVDAEHLRLVIDRALRERQLQDEVASLREQLQKRYSFHNVLSKNAKMHDIFETVTNLSHTKTTVLIEGETGTGKEQLAKAIHYTSEQKNGPWVAVNCAALPETLLESELFGHEKGSFTSAVGQRKGRFEMADGGTIFLDEVGDIPATMQAKLLRVLQERCFERVGGTETVEVDVRVIAATNRDLQDLVKQETFREDLYYRINVVKLHLPPLRERREDIPLLAENFVEKFSPSGVPPKKISPQAMNVLINHNWPGNIRELQNAIERACVTSTGEEIHGENLPPELAQSKNKRAIEEIDFHRPLKDVVKQAIAGVEERYLREILRRTHGDVGQCAKLCGMSRRSISTKITEYGIDKTQFKNMESALSEESSV